MHQQTGLPTFVDAFVPEGLGMNETLERIDAVLDWERIGKVVAEVHAAPEGRPGYPPLTMVKIALLQQWYTASDPAMEEALRDRISFRRFVNLGWMDGTPDHSTISRFRKALTERGLTERLFAEVNRQFEERRLLVKQGTLLDRVGRVGDGWFPNMGPKQVAEGLKKVHAAAERAGRDPKSIGLETSEAIIKQSPEEAAARGQIWKELGLTHFALNTMGAGLDGVDAHLNALRRFKAALEPW